VQLPSVTELSMLRSLTKLAAYIGNNELDWRRTGASVVVRTPKPRAVKPIAVCTHDEQHNAVLQCKLSWMMLKGYEPVVPCTECDEMQYGIALRD
jgi:hypothetical protein